MSKHLTESEVIAPSRRHFLLGTAAALGVAGLDGMLPRIALAEASSPQPTFQLPALPYAEGALDPIISARTVGIHYGKHHQGYLTRVNELVAGTPLASLELQVLIQKVAGDPAQTGLFNAAAQTWNHTFYWNSLKPKGGGKPTGKLLTAIEGAYGNFDTFKDTFVKTAVGVFGTGWAWVVIENGKLKIVGTQDAEVPFTKGQTPLLTVDVWEHAYYLDYQNKRKDYVEAVFNGLLNWDFAAENLGRIKA